MDIRIRTVALGVLVGILAVFLVWTGTMDPGPNYADEEALTLEYDAHVGEPAEIGGQIVETNPVRIEIEYGPHRRILTVTGVNGEVEEGHHLRVFGSVTEDHTVEAQTVVVREPWELWYVYGVSLLGGFWVLGRFVSGWRFDRKTNAFVPRQTSWTTARFGRNEDG